MPAWRLLLQCGALLLVQTAAAAQTVSVEYNPFDDLTRVATHGLAFPVFSESDDYHDLGFLLTYISYHCPGNALCEPEVVEFRVIAGHHTGWAYESDRDIIFLLNGEERVPLGDALLERELEFDPQYPSFVETLRTEISFPVFARIAASGSVAFQAGPTQVEVSDRGLAAWREAVSKAAGTQVRP
jgi:hypothetical protein